MQIIDSDHVMKATEIYVQDDKIFMILEFMDGKELTKVI